jgi:hypothetical protein
MTAQAMAAASILPRITRVNAMSMTAPEELQRTPGGLQEAAQSRGTNRPLTTTVYGLLQIAGAASTAA